MCMCMGFDSQLIGLYREEVTHINYADGLFMKISFIEILNKSVRISFPVSHSSFVCHICKWRISRDKLKCVLKVLSTFSIGCLWHDFFPWDGVYNRISISICWAHVDCFTIWMTLSKLSVFFTFSHAKYMFETIVHWANELLMGTSQTKSHFRVWELS